MPSKPVPAPDPWSAPYWEAARQHRLVVQVCEECGHAQYPPEVVCTACRSDRLRFDDVSGRGTVYSFAVFPRSMMPVFEAPYTLALVDLDDVPSVRMMTNIVEAAPDLVEVGMPVEVVFEERGEWSIPQFRPVDGVAR